MVHTMVEPHFAIMILCKEIITIIYYYIPWASRWSSSCSYAMRLSPCISWYAMIGQSHHSLPCQPFQLGRCWQRNSSWCISGLLNLFSEITGELHNGRSMMEINLLVNNYTNPDNQRNRNVHSQMQHLNVENMWRFPCFELSIKLRKNTHTINIK